MGETMGNFRMTLTMDTEKNVDGSTHIARRRGRRAHGRQFVAAYSETKCVGGNTPRHEDKEDKEDGEDDVRLAQVREKDERVSDVSEVDTTAVRRA